MADKPILYTKKEHVGYITLNRPKRGNRIDPAMAQELAEVCTQINGDEEAYLVVVTGAGDKFCSGKAGPLPLKNNPAESFGQIECPTLAALNGEAIGEGLEIALACDLRIAADKAKFALPQITEGYIPLGGGTQRLSRIVGKGKALEMILTGETIDAKAAYEIGLVNKVVSHEGLMSEVETLANSLAGKGPIALRYVKEAVNKGLDLTLEQGLRLEADLYFLIHTTADRTEGIHAFLEKRKPEYKGK